MHWPIGQLKKPIRSKMRPRMCAIWKKKNTKMEFNKLIESILAGPLYPPLTADNVVCAPCGDGLCLAIGAASILTVAKYIYAPHRTCYVTFSVAGHTRLISNHRKLWQSAAGQIELKTQHWMDGLALFLNCREMLTCNSSRSSSE